MAEALTSKHLVVEALTDRGAHGVGGGGHIHVLVPGENVHAGDVGLGVTVLKREWRQAVKNAADAEAEARVARAGAALTLPVLEVVSSMTCSGAR